MHSWAATPPGWLEILPVTPIEDPALQILDPGEKAALTLGLLVRAAQEGIFDFPSALQRLKETNFHYREELISDLLAKYKRAQK